MSLAILLVYSKSWLLDYRVNQLLLYFYFLRRLPNDFSAFISYFSRSNARRVRKSGKTIRLWELTVTITVVIANTREKCESMNLFHSLSMHFLYSVVVILSHFLYNVFTRDIKIKKRNSLFVTD